MLGFNEWLFIIIIFLTSVGKYLVMPFFAIYLTASLGYSVGTAGVIISILIWSQRISAIVSGPLADALGRKWVVVTGLLLAGAGCLGIAKVESLHAIVFWSIIFGSGGALPLPAIKATLTHFKGVDKRVVFSIRKMAVNVGVVIGPLIGTLIFKYSRSTVFMIASSVFICLSFVSLMVLSKIHQTPSQDLLAKHNVTKNISPFFLSRNFLFLMLCTFIFYAVFMQIELTFPLYVKEMYSINLVWLLYAVNALIIVLFQVPFARILKIHSFLNIYSMGLVCFLMCFGVLGAIEDHLLLFIFSIILFSFGELLISPMLDVEASNIVSPQMLATAFGILGMASALGAALGGVVGGNLYETFYSMNILDQYWLSIGVFLLFSIGIVLLIGKKLKSKVALQGESVI